MGLDEPVEYPLTYSRLDETLNRDDGGSGVLKDATSDLYAFGPNGESACSLGYTFITDKAMCQEAVEILAPGNWTGVSNDWGTANPKGCFYDGGANTENKNGFFNRAEVGGANQSGDMTICIRQSESDCEPCDDGFYYCPNKGGSGREGPFCDKDPDCYGDDDNCQGGQTSGCVISVNSCD